MSGNSSMTTINGLMDKIKIGFSSLSKTQIAIGILIPIIIGALAYYFYKTKSVEAFNANRENVPKGESEDKIATVMLFYVDWCPHCKTAKPVWNDMKTEYEGTMINGYKVTFVEHNCTKESAETQELLDKYNVEGFPTIILIKDKQVIDYDAKPTKDTMVQFLNTVL
jgi:thiol-disulfide isomerase/thioredoxin